MEWRVITDPTVLFQTLINCIDEESGQSNNLPKASPQAVADLLMDDLPEEDVQTRGMQRLAANTINDLSIALRAIAGGSFPDASTLAANGAWKEFTERLQGIARKALPSA
jgi:hypothetical protein